MATLQATRMKKGMLIKMGEDLFRVLDVQHVTPGNLRGFVRVKMRNIRSGLLADNRFRSEDTVERETLDEREMQYLYQDGDDYYFMTRRRSSRCICRARRWGSRSAISSRR
jgi:elongation factor P